ncbi:MAG TPA: ABC transporter permease subunit [Ktedonobacterales bacterium]|nr:ABC transporter permease subunit [Ktedonobacterales bacterium]
MNWRAVGALARKDLREVRMNKVAWIPAAIVPMVIVVLLPLAFILAPNLFAPATGTTNSAANVQTLISLVPPSMVDELHGLNDAQRWVVFSTGFVSAPMLLLLPLMFSSIAGADSFVGERERKTLEALLYTPASDGELFLGKVIGSVVPALLLTWLSFAVYATVVNVAGWYIMHRVWFPTAAWWPLMLWVAPAIATLGMAAAVLISSRVSTFMEAYQLTGTLVIVVLALVVGQATGVLSLSVPVTFLVGAGLWAVDAVLVWLSVRLFSRGAVKSLA